MLDSVPGDRWRNLVTGQAVALVPLLLLAAFGLLLTGAAIAILACLAVAIARVHHDRRNGMRFDRIDLAYLLSGGASLIIISIILKLISLWV